jgi:hypothetical protein
MSYAGLGIAIPMYRGVTARSGMPVARGVTARSVMARGLRGLGASQSTLADAAAAAVAAVRASAAAGTLRTANTAVRQFQMTYGGLTVDGVYGPNTRSALQTVTGILDLPPAPGSSSTSSSSSSSSSYVAPVPDALPTEEYGAASTPSWMVPVAVVSVLVLVAGGIIYRQRRPMRANRKRKRSCRTCGRSGCKTH